MTRSNLGTLMVAVLILVAVALGKRNDIPASSPLRAAAAEFVVTASGDAGPGTLRDAILAADRLSTAAHIRITAKRIAIESSLPSLINPHGVVIDGGSTVVIDAARQSKGVVMQINSPMSAVRGLHIEHAQGAAILANAPGIEMDTITISNSKVGMVIAGAAKGCVIRKSLFEGNDIGITAEAAVRDVTIVGSVFRGNTRAGFWFVGAEDSAAPIDKAPKAQETVRESVRIVEAVFEDNASAVVLANRPTLIQRSRFARNHESAISVLSGAARVEDCDIEGTEGTALTVISGKPVFIVHNVLADNAKTAIMVRDSEITIENNTVRGNGFGVVVISKQPLTATIRDNLVTKNTADAITLIGGSPLLQRNRVIENRNAGLRILDWVTEQGELKATPRLESNTVTGNGVDMPAAAAYKVAAARDRS